MGDVLPLRQAKRDPSAPTLLCITCRREKPREDFYRMHKGSEARQSRCKSCDNEVRMHGVRRAEGPGEPQGDVFAHRVRRDARDFFAEEPEEESVDQGGEWTKERIFRQRVGLVYERQSLARIGRVRHKNDDRARPEDHLVDDDEVDRWSNEVLAELRAGSELRVALKQANRSTEGLGDEEPPRSLFLDAPPPGPGRPGRAAELEIVVEMPMPSGVPTETKADERICRGCTHPEAWHAEREGMPLPACSHCGCTNFRPILTREERLAARAAEAAVAKCPAVGGRGRPCGKPAIHGDWCVVHGMRRERGIEVRVATTAAQRKDGIMSTYPKGQRSPKTEENCEAIVKHLKAHGPTARGDLMAALGLGETDTNCALRALAEDGTAEVRGMARAARWSMKGDERAATPRTIADVAKKAARKQAKKTTKAKGNGHTSVRMVHVEAEGAAGTVKAALDALAAALTQDFNAKMAAIKTLGG